MAKRGRRSEASLNVVPFAPVVKKQTIKPRIALSAPVRQTFNETIAHNPHLRAADASILTLYCMALHASYKLAKRTDAEGIKGFDKVVRATAMLATKLRITAQSQVHPETAGRRARDANAKTSPQPQEDEFADYSVDEIGDDEDAAG